MRGEAISEGLLDPASYMATAGNAGNCVSFCFSRPRTTLSPSSPGRLGGPNELNTRRVSIPREYPEYAFELAGVLSNAFSWHITKVASDTSNHKRAPLDVFKTSKCSFLSTRPLVTSNAMCFTNA